MQIGEKIKQLRMQHRLTQEELANRCELSKGFISQLERDLTSPSISTLMDILECLGTNLKDFFNETTEEKLVFGVNDYPVKESPESSVTWLVPSAQKNSMEPIMVVLNPGCSTEVDNPHEGEEFGYVLSGKLILHSKRKKVPQGRQLLFSFGTAALYRESGKNSGAADMGQYAAELLIITVNAACFLPNGAA